MKQTIERHIEENAKVLETERVFDVSITQFWSVGSLKKLELERKQTVNSAYAIFECNTLNDYLYLWKCPV